MPENIQASDTGGQIIPTSYLDIVKGALNAGLQIYETWKALQTHPLATQWVAAIQDPFGTNLSIIVDAKDAQVAAGTATADDIYFARQAVVKLWLGYQDIATKFAAQGEKEAKVIGQSYNTLAPLIKSILEGMNKQIEERGGASAAAKLGVNVSHFSILIVIAFLVLITILTLRSLR